MAYNVRQLQELQDKISMKPDVPNAIDRYAAMKLLQRRPVRRPMRREQGGELQDNANELASKGRYGDTMLMHVTPDEVRGLSSLRGGITINPETGLPEAFDPITMALIGAAIGGFGSAATGGDPIKGALMGAIGGFMPAALGGLATTTGLGALWTGLGPIGQGMLSGAAMGGVRSLFGDSDNPLRDILIGGAMGGVGGAMFPQTVEAAGIEGMELGEGVRKGIGDMIPTVQNVPAYGEPISSTYQAARSGFPVDAGQVSSQAIRQLSPSLKAVEGQFGPLVTQPTSMGYDQAITPRLDILKGGYGSDRVRGGEDLDFGFDFKRSATDTDSRIPDYVREDILAGKRESILASKPLPPERSIGEKAEAWLGRQDDLTKYGMLGGAGLLASGAFGEQPQQAELAQARSPSAIPFLPAKPLRTPISRGDEEETAAQFYERTIGEGRTPEEAKYFTEEEVEDVDFNVAKEGGIVSLFNGGNPYTSDPYGTPTYAQGLTNRPDAMQRPIQSMGDPRYAKPMSLTEWNVNFGPGSEYAGEGGGDGGGAPELSPFVFPEVTPFKSNLASFSTRNRLSDIAGPAQTFAPTPASTPTPVSPIPVSSISQTGLEQLQQLALSNAASVAAQALSPTATVAAPVPTTAVNPEEQSIIDQFIGQEGGIIGLANGGSIPPFGTNTPVFEGRVQGFGDGMADQVSFGVVPQTPADIQNTPDMALLSSDEYVVPADVVSMLGNGSSTAGSQALDRFNKLMRMKAHGTNKQQRELNAGRELSSLV
jgi:hypothetical protein